MLSKFDDIFLLYYKIIKLRRKCFVSFKFPLIN